MVGLLTSLSVAALAWWRGRTRTGFYDGDVYGMTRRSHLRYVAVELFAALVFLGTLVGRAETVAAWCFAAIAIVDVFYLTSFLRGASEEEP